ncbi:MAG: urease accessory UreF family protein [Pseudomonadota bacterium]
MNGLLTLTQWLSPAFPLGSFAYSHGLETGIAQGTITDATDVQAWLESVLQYGAGCSDATLLALALKGSDAAMLSAEARALAPSQERWDETTAQGRAFSDAVAATGHRVEPAPLPIALGLAARGLGVAHRDVVALYLQAFASNLVTVAIRFVPLGQSEGQRVLTALQPLIKDCAEAALKRGLGDITSAVPGADLWAMQHEALEVRMFKS